LPSHAPAPSCAPAAPGRNNAPVCSSSAPVARCTPPFPWDGGGASTGCRAMPPCPAASPRGLLASASKSCLLANDVINTIGLCLTNGRCVEPSPPRPLRLNRVCGAHTSCLCLYINIHIQLCVCVCVPATYPSHRVHDAHTSQCLCRDWSSHASRTMSSIKTNVYGAALEYGLEDHKGVESCRRQQIPS